MEAIRHEDYMKQQIDEMEAATDRIISKIDLINSPPHYNQGDIECIDAIRSALGDEGFAAYCRGNIIKYQWRCDHKGGLQDVEKAQWYAAKLIDTMRTNTEHNAPRRKENKHQ